MASIFKNAVNFVGETLKQAVLTQYDLKDFRHASELFVGENFKLVPKSGFLFHVFFDIDPALASQFVSDNQRQPFIGMMVKNCDLPRYTLETKTYNAYNRPNIVQSKIKFDPISITFHDDSANIVRNFWYDYYRYYFRDSDHAEPAYTTEHKYLPQQYTFGYTRRSEDYRPYIRNIRIYSLHRRLFSEYTLINPIIKSFRHGQHSNAGESTPLQHEMTVEFENILYKSGVAADGAFGFAKLKYDTTPSPLRTAGRTRSIFGEGGLLDTAGSVLGDIERGDYLSAIFKTARGINTAKSMNLKKAVVSEVGSIFKQAAAGAVVGAVTQGIRSISPTGYNVPTFNAAAGSVSNKFNGIEAIGSAAALVGVNAIISNYSDRTNRYKTNPVIQSSVEKPSNYTPRFPVNPGAVRPQTVDSNLVLASDPRTRFVNTEQKDISKLQSKTTIEDSVKSLTATLTVLKSELAQINLQIANTTQLLTMVNQKISQVTALSSTATGRAQLLAELEQQKQYHEQELSKAKQLQNTANSKIRETQVTINRYLNQLSSLK